VLFCVLFVCKCVLPPGDNPIAVNKYIILYYTTTSHSSNNGITFATILSLTWALDGGGTVVLVYY
jgi:hypothetical protein